MSVACPLPELSLDLSSALLAGTGPLSQWPEARVRETVENYRRFLALAARYPNTSLAPTYAIDEVWHLHMLHPEAYARDCQAIFGGLLDHAPGRKGDPGSAKALFACFDVTRDLWVKTFGLPYELDRPLSRCALTAPERPVRDPWLEGSYYDEGYADYCLGELAPNHGGPEALGFLESRILAPLGRPRILDHCCGFGAWAAPLEARGWDVTGLDSNPTFLRLARERLGFRGPLVEADAAEWEPEGAFDVILSMGGTFPCFEPEAVPRILAGLHRALRPGGSLLVQCVNPDHVLRHYQDRSWHLGQGDLLVAAEWDFSRPERWTITHRRFRAQGNGLWEGSLHHYQVTPYRRERMESLLAAHGFAPVAAWGDFQGGPVDEAHRYIILQARREAPSD